MINNSHNQSFSRTMTLTTTMTSQQSRNLIKLPPVCESFFTYPQSQAIPLTRPVICSPQRNRSVFAFKLNFFRLICRPDLFVLYCHLTNHSSEADPLISPVVGSVPSGLIKKTKSTRITQSSLSCCYYYLATNNTLRGFP